MYIPVRMDANTKMVENKPYTIKIYINHYIIIKYYIYG